MPIIDLRNEEGKLDAASPLRLWAIMAHPDQKEHRDQYLARVMEHVYAVLESSLRQDLEGEHDAEKLLTPTIGELLGNALSSLGGFSTLAKAPAHEDAREMLLGAFWGGSIAGDMLLNILQMDASGENGSVRKACFLAEDYLTRARTESGRSLGGSKRLIMQFWSRYKPVVHLWCAYRLWFFEGAEVEGYGFADVDSWFSPVRTESLPAFLSVSTALLGLGANHYSHGRRTPTLSLTESWLAPEDLLQPVDFVIPDLEQWKLDLLEKYRPDL